MNSTRGTLEELNVQGLQPGTEYVVRVVAHNEHGSGDSSDPLRVRNAANLGRAVEMLLLQLLI